MHNSLRLEKIAIAKGCTLAIAPWLGVLQSEILSFVKRFNTALEYDTLSSRVLQFKKYLVVCLTT